MIYWGQPIRSLIPSITVLGLLVAATGCANQPKPQTEAPEGVDYYVQGVTAQRAGDADKATELFEKAVAANPNLRMAHINLGDTYRTKGDYARAANHYDSATKLDPYALYNHYNLGLAYQLLNRLQDSAKAYLKALELNPSDVRSNMNLGLVYMALGENDSAVAFLDRATRLDGSSSTAWSNLGVALDAQGDLARAEVTYRKALELDSSNLATMQNLAQNLISQKKAPEAVTIMEQVLPKDQSPPVRRRYAEALGMAKRFDPAIAELDRILAADPNYVPALNTKADVLIFRYVDGLELDNKLRLAALELWRKSLSIKPGQPQVAELFQKWENPRIFGR